MKTVNLSILSSLLVLFTYCSSSVGIEYETKGVKVSTSYKFEVLEFNPKYFEFGVSEGRPTNTNFYINSNFFDQGSIPRGRVVIDGKEKYGKQRSKKIEKKGGFFYVKNGKPYVRSKNCPSYTDYCSQSVFWGIDNVVFNTFSLTEPHAKLRNFRTLIGENKKGEIILIVSKIPLDMKTILDFSKDYNLVDAIFCDGGTSVDYYFDNGKYFSTFKSIPDIFKIWSQKISFIKSIDFPPVYITGSFK
ncbi:MAG: phosphodiester glycosidase family protein [Flavobacteriales bacterium]